MSRTYDKKTLRRVAEKRGVAREHHKDDPRRYCHCSLLRQPLSACPTGRCKNTAPIVKPSWESPLSVDPEDMPLTFTMFETGSRR